MHLALQRELGRRYGHAIAWENVEKWRGHPPMLGGAGIGWFSLQDRLFRVWAESGYQWTIHHIKEKYGALDISATSPDAPGGHPRDIHYIEVASERVCDVCGAPGRMAETPCRWLFTRCERHLAGSVASADNQALTRLPDFEHVENALREMRAAAPDPTVPAGATWLPIEEPSGDREVAQCLDRALVWIIESRDRLFSDEQLATYLPSSLARDLLAALDQQKYLPASRIVDWIDYRLQRTHRRLTAHDEGSQWIFLNCPDPVRIPW